MKKLLFFFLLSVNLCFCNGQGTIPKNFVATNSETRTYADYQEFTIERPNLSALTRGVDYIVIDASYSFVIGNCTTDNSNYDKCKTNTPSCNLDQRPYCASQTWSSLIFQQPAYTNGTLKYVLIKPGEYRALGRLYANGINGTAENPLYIMYWDSVNNRFDPPNDSSYSSQAVLEAIYLNNSNHIVFHGLVFDGVGLRYGTDTVGWGHTIDANSNYNVMSNCLTQNTNSIGLRVRNSNYNWIQDNQMRNPANPCADPPGVYIHSSFDSCEFNRVLNNKIYNFSDGIQVGDILPEGVSTRGTIIAGNDLYMDSSRIYIQDGMEVMLAENAIDLKIGGSPANRMIVTGNVMHTYRPTPDTTGCGLGSLGKIATIHFDCDYLDFYNNYLYDGTIGIALSGTLRNHNYYSNVIADIFYEPGAIQPQQTGGAYLTANTMDSVNIYSNYFINTDSCIRFVGAWAQVDTVAQKMYSNLFQTVNFLQFESGSPIQPFSNQVNARNDRNLQAAFQPSFINRNDYPVLNMPIHKVLRYPYTQTPTP